MKRFLIIAGLVYAAGLAAELRGQTVSWIWNSPNPLTARSTVEYMVSVVASPADHVELKKNGLTVGISESGVPAVTVNTTDTGAQSVEYTAIAYDSSNAVIATLSRTVEITADSQAPAVPASLGATTSNVTVSSFTLTWNAFTDNGAISGYQVERLDGSNWVLVASPSAPSCPLTGMTEAQTYTFRIRARDDYNNWSSWSPSFTKRTKDITGPAAPTVLQHSAVTSNSFVLQWNPAEDNAGPSAITTYEVRRDQDIIATVSSSTFSVSVTGLASSREYQMSVRARDDSFNWGPLSAPLEVETAPPYGGGTLSLPSQGSSSYSGTNPNNPEGWHLVATSGQITTSPSVTVNSGAKVKFVAGSRVTLGAGFRANSGATFVARAGNDTTDSDGDGMSDLYESASGLNPGSANDALLDSDSDGLTNIAEANLKMDAGTPDAGSASTGGSLPANWPVPDPVTSDPVGITSGELSVTPGGAAAYSIPIWVSPGTAGMEPKLTINYSSQSGPGILGWGWSIGGLSAISRGPQTLAVDGDGYVPGVNLTSTDRFYMDGQRLIHTGGTYGADGTDYRTEIDSFSRVISKGAQGNGPLWFQVWTKAGLIIEFGNTAESRLMVGSSVRTWAVSKISDTFGNYMEFVYTNETVNGALEQRISRINYTGHSSGPVVTPYASVRFDYEDRPDKAEGFFKGVKYASTKRLTAIKSFYAEIPVRTYQFSYQQRPITSRSMLTSVTEIGTGAVALRPLTFQYSESDQGWTLASSTWNVSSNQANYLLADNVAQKQTGSGFIDFNGDGRTDFFFRNSDPGTSKALRNNGSGWTDDPSYELPWPLVRSDGTDAGGRFADVNGDGLVDLLWNHGQESQIGACLNTGSGWSADQMNWRPPARVADGGYPLASGSFMDMNGDGRVDFVTWYPAPGGPTGYKLYVFLNTGSGWSGAHSGYGTTISGASYDLWQKKARFVDFNGDGLPDLVVYHRLNNGASDSGHVKGAWRNTGSGWVYASEFIPKRYIACDDYGTVGTEFVDLNGDGLVDQAWSLPVGAPGAGSGIALNNGNDWDDYYPGSAEYSRYAAHASMGQVVGTELRPTFTYADLNGDGAVDVASRRINTVGYDIHDHRLGNGWAFNDNVPESDLPAPLSLGTIPQKAAGVDLVDLNGDGVVDVVQRRRNATGVSPTYDHAVWLNDASQADRLITVTNGFGVQAEITYEPLTNSTVYTKATDFADIVDSANVANVAGPMLVVASVTHDDGAGGDYTMIYDYAGMRSHRTRGSLGFAKMEVLDGRTNILSRTEFNQNFPFVGSPSKTSTIASNGGGTILSESSTTFDRRVTGFTDTSFNPDKTFSVYFPFAKSSVAKSRDLDGGLTSATQTITQTGAAGSSSDYDEYGNSKYVEVNSATTFTGSYPNEVPNYLGGYRKVTSNTYDNTVDASKWWLGRLSTATVSSYEPGNGTPMVRKSGFGYHPTHGVLNSEVLEPDSTDNRIKLTTEYTFDEFGNRTQVSVEGTGETRTATTRYAPLEPGDPTHRRFPLATTNALGHTSHAYFIEHWGVPWGQADINVLVTGMWYDEFARVIRTDHPDGTYTTMQRHWAWGNTAPGAKYYVQTQRFASGGTPISAPAVEFFDRLGRSIRKLAVNGDGRAVATDTRYDSMGRAHRGSKPFYSDQPEANIIWSETASFDLLGRPLSVRTPDDEADHAPNGYVTTTYSYGSRTALGGADSGVIGTFGRVTNPKSKVTRNKTNSQGWVVEIIQNETANTNDLDRTTLTKTYDPLGQLKDTQTNGEAASTISHGYDVRGRRVWTWDPDMAPMPTGGQTKADVGWKYQYNAFGELTKQTDALGQVTDMEYDALSRLELRNDGTERRKWTYDTAPNRGLGKPHTAEVRNTADTIISSETYAYEPWLGRPASTSYLIGGTTYVTSVNYDDSIDPSRIKQTTYPNSGSGSFITENRYNTFGVLKEVWRTDLAVDQILWMAAPLNAYNAAGALEVYILGNGVSTERVISDATGRVRAINTGRMQSPGFTNPTTQAGFDTQKLIYNFDEVGNVDQRFNTNVLDDTKSVNETFAYDGLNRVTDQWIIPGGLSQTLFMHVGYDKRGNITSKTDVGAYTYDPVKIHAVTGAAGITYAYNANGNMTSSWVTATLAAHRSMTWTKFNQISSITMPGGKTSSFTFNAANQRITQASHNGDTVYVGSLYEKYTVPAGQGGYTDHIHWIITPAGRVGSFKQRSTGYTEQQFFHQDGLGSVVAVTNAWGVVAERFYYDAWGKHFEGTPGTSTDPLIPVTWATTNTKLSRGFTGHEHLDDLGLIHMNGRVYDPVLGRFLSADPNIDGTDDSQGYNRFSYVGNNPLNATDPTGYLKLKEVLGAVVGIVVGAIVTAFTGPGGATFWAKLAAGVKDLAAAVAGGAAGGFASGFSGSLLNGGSIGDAFKAGIVGAATGAATAWAAHGIGSFFDGLAERLGDSVWNTLGRMGAHGAVGGLAAEASGGDFRHGFYGSAASTGVMRIKGVRSFLGGSDSNKIAHRTVLAAAIGGTVSVISGGKFANGAITSAFQHLFNSEAGQLIKPKARAIIFMEASFANQPLRDGGTVRRYFEDYIDRFNRQLERAGSEVQVDFVTFVSMEDLAAMAPDVADKNLVYAAAILHGDPNSDPALVMESVGHWVPETEFIGTFWTLKASDHRLITCTHGQIRNAAAAIPQMLEALYSNGLLPRPPHRRSQETEP